MNDFLNVDGKIFLVTGFANRKSIAWFVAETLKNLGAEIIFSVRSQKRMEELKKILPSASIFVCDFENERDFETLSTSIDKQFKGSIDGILHSVAFAEYSEGLKPFHETKLNDFLQATHISSFSLIQLSNACKNILANDASVVTIGISSTDVTAENYGYMAPVKASLEANVRYLAKSFSSFSSIRFNSVNAGPLKTSASAGIPGYLVNYLYAEKLTFRKKALTTQEVANTATYLLSPSSSGINGQGIVVDAGMGFNYFDKEVVNQAMKITP
jgi:enoyl-[acyl-carrier protein] reductase I|tara:strand:+ start:141 stop:953 length:813 start_codon:yes stop_codon:yes gene_type:complete